MSLITGKTILTNSIRGTEFAVDSYGRHVDRLTEYMGGKSQRMLDKDRADTIESKFRRQVALGNIELNPGVEMEEVLELLRKGQYNKARELYAKKGAKKKAPRKLKPGYYDQKTGIYFENQTHSTEGPASAFKEKRPSSSPFGGPDNATADSILQKIRREKNTTQEETATESTEEEKDTASEETAENVSEKIRNRHSHTPRTTDGKITSDKILDNIRKRPRHSQSSVSKSEPSADDVLNRIRREKKPTGFGSGSDMFLAN